MAKIAIDGHRRLAVVFCGRGDYGVDVLNAKAAELAARDLAEALDDRSAS